MDPTSDSPWRAATRAWMAAVGVGWLAAIAWTGFHVGHNDFWGNLALAQQLVLTAPSTWYNAFYPFGYALVLRPVLAWPVVPGLLLNVACGMLLLAALARIVTRLAGPAWAFAACVLLSAHPQIVRYATTPGADIVAAMLVAAGCDRLVASSDESGRASSIVPAGLLLGAAALLRYQALVLGVLTIGAASAAWPSVRRRAGLAFASFAGVYALQMIVAMLAHHGPLHTGQALVFQKLVHPVNWFHVDDTSAPPTAFDVIAAAPREFLRAYARQLRPLALLLVPSALLAGVARDERLRRFAIVALLVLAPYCAIVATGGSSRADIPVLFLVAASVAGLGRAASMAMSPRSMLALGFAAALFKGVPWLREDYGTFKHRRQEDQAFRRVEAILRGDGVASARQVFASDLTLYFPSLPGYTPRTNGTWLRYDGRTYNARVPELCVDSAECFLGDARAFEITHLVLTREARDLSPAIDGLYRAPTSGVEPIEEDGNFKVYRIR